MRLIIIILLFATGLQAQQKSSIFLGDGSGSSPTFDSDSMGLVVSMGEIVIGTGSKAPGSSDSLFWNAGLFVDAPVNFSALVAGAVDSLLYIDTLGFVGKTAVVANTNIYNSDGTLTGNRTITGAGNDLTLTGFDQVNLGSTTGAINVSTPGGQFSVSAGGLIYFAGSTILFDGPDIFLDDPLTLSTWDSILVRHPVTGEIQARLASTLRDSLGTAFTANHLIRGNGTRGGQADAELLFNPTTDVLRIDKGGEGTSYLEIYDNSNQVAGINKVVASSFGIFDFGVTPSDGTSLAVIRFNRNAATSGGSYMEVHRGDGGFVGARISGSAIDGWLQFYGGNLGIGTQSPNASSKVDITSTTGGLTVPRVTTTQRDAFTTPINGCIIYNSTTNKFQGRAGAAWVDLH